MQQQQELIIDEKLSYSKCLSDNFEFSTQTLRDRLNIMASLYPDHAPFIFQQNGGLELTYAELKSRVDIMAKNLWYLGFRPGDRLAFQLPDTVEFIVVLVTCSVLGLISVPIDPNRYDYEIEYMLELSNPKGYILLNSFENIDYFEFFKKICPEIETTVRGQLHCAKFDNLAHVFVIEHLENLDLTTLNDNDSQRVWRFDQISKPNDQFDIQKFQYPKLNPHDPSFMIFTVSFLIIKVKLVLKYSIFLICF